MFKVTNVSGVVTLYGPSITPYIGLTEPPRLSIAPG
jgi:hypothetical protein